jgi:hypothetical protein
MLFFGQFRYGCAHAKTAPYILYFSTVLVDNLNLKLYNFSCPKNATNGGADISRSGRHGPPSLAQIGVKEMKTWQSRKTTTHQPEMPPENQSQNSSESTDGELEVQWMLLIGLLLNQISCLEQYGQLHRRALQFNLATPVMVEASLFALSAMASHITTTFDQLKASTYIWNRSSQIMRVRDGIVEAGTMAEDLFLDICLDYRIYDAPHH